MCDMTHLHAGYDSYICGAWLIQMWDMTHTYVGHDSFVRGTWLLDYPQQIDIIANEPCPTWVRHVTFESIMSRMNTSCHTHESWPQVPPRVSFCYCTAQSRCGWTSRVTHAPIMKWYSRRKSHAHQPARTQIARLESWTLCAQLCVWTSRVTRAPTSFH